MNRPPFPDYQVAGSNADTTVYLFHGAYGSKDYFRYQIETLVGAGFRVVAWDAPGYGLSPLPEEGLSIERLADSAALLVEKTCSRKNVLLGHSMGGIMAPAVCARVPNLVHGLVISATVGSFSQKSEADKKTFLAERIDPLKQGRSFRETAMPVILSMFANGSSGPMVDLVREVAAATRAETFIQGISSIVHYDGVPNLRKVQVPTLLIAGEQDKVGRPDGMRALREFIPQAEFVCIPNAGHYAFAEQHALFNEHLIKFIRSAVQRD